MALGRQKNGYTFGYTMVTQCEKCVTFFLGKQKPFLSCVSTFRVGDTGGKGKRFERNSYRVAVDYSKNF